MEKETNNTNAAPQGAQEQGRPLNIVEYAARQQAAFSRGIADLNGYKTITTFWADLTIVEAFGLDAVQDTYNRVKKEWAHNYEYFTEFILCLNHKIWQHYKTNEPLARLYDKLWREADEIAATWTGEAAEHYFNVTD